MTIKFAIITCSDTRTLETDEAGQKLEELIAAEGWECIRRVVEKDERPFIAGALLDACDHTDADVVLTCGGSGLNPKALESKINGYNISDYYAMQVSELIPACPCGT